MDRVTGPWPQGWLLLLLVLGLALWHGMLFAPGRLDAEGPAERGTSAAVDLRPKFEEGRDSRFYFKSQIDQHMVRQRGEKKRSATMSTILEGEIDWRIKRVRDDGSATCLMTVRWLSNTTTTDREQRQVTDSRQPRGDDEGRHALFQATVDVPLLVEVQADGSVTGVSGHEVIAPRVPEDVAVPDEQDYIQWASEIALLPSAPGAVEIGDTWENHHIEPHPLGSIRYDTQYRLKMVEEVAGIPVATVAATSDLSLKPDDSRLSRNHPPEIRLQRGEQASQIFLDLQRGEVVGRETVETIETAVSRRLPDGARTRIIRTIKQGKLLRVGAETQENAD